MRNTRQRDNYCELAIRSMLHEQGLRFRVHTRIQCIPRRTADIVFPKEQVAVFIDGCFWHRCPTHGTLPIANRAWWRHKLKTNTKRDRDTDQRLHAAGWKVVRIWEHEDPSRAAGRISKVLFTRRI